MQWEALRDAYVERFGALFDACEVEDKRGRRPPFWLLSFWNADAPESPVVYASFGAPGREIVAVAVAPIFALEEALKEVASGGPAAFAPYEVVRAPVARTPFFGFLVAPVEDGSFVVQGEGSDRIEVSRLIPVTRAERVFAVEKDAREAYRRVREAQAIVADPLRACTIAPQRTALWQKLDAPPLVKALREHVAEIEQRLATRRAEGAPAGRVAWYQRVALRDRAYLRYLEARLPHIPTDDEVVAAVRAAPPGTRVDRVADALAERALTGSEPEGARAGMLEFVCFLVHTHPEALRLVEALIDEPILPAATAGFEAVVRACAQRIVDFVGIMHPTSDRHDLESRVRQGAEKARRTLDPTGEVPHENHAWACMAEAVYAGVHDTSTLSGRSVAAGFRSVIDVSRILELDPSVDPPFPRLVTIVQGCVMSMFMAAGAVAKRELDN